jgi:hypothetical protein
MGPVLLLVATVGGIAFTAYLLFKPPWPSSRIDPAAYCRIKPGMRREEVIASVGLPPGNYRSRELDDDPDFCGLYELACWGEDAWFYTPRPEGATCDRWLSDSYLIQVEFGPEGGARSCLLYESRWLSSWPTFDRVRAWVGW